MSKTITSGTITFMDTTDDRKLDVYISSNHPNSQIYNSNSGKYTPDWSITNLKLSAEIYLDSKDVTADTQTDIGWYTKIGTTETLVGTGTSLTISTNTLDTNPIITYICKAEYQNVDALSQITFTRVDTGLNGSDGTSVKIKGTATSVTKVVDTDYYTLAYSGSGVSTAELNDAYMYNGDLYVCVDSRDGVDYFINVGRIQGPAGTPAKNVILSGSAQVFKINKTGTVTPATISVIAHTFNTAVSKWTYSTNGGQTFVSVPPAGLVLDGNIITITGASLATNSITIKASDGEVEDVLTIYKAFDGTDGVSGVPGDPAPFAFLTNENVSFAANANGQVSTTAFTSNVVSYVGTTKTTPVLGTITGLPTGMTVSSPLTVANELILTFSIEDKANFDSDESNNGTINIPVTSPVSTNLKLNWSKINAGADGNTGAPGSNAVTFQVYSSNGYALSINTPTITLQTFAYVGDVEITAGATYQWYGYHDAWSAISGETAPYMDVSRDDVSFSKSYMCKMNFDGVEYTSVVTIDDKNDTNKVFSIKPSNYTVGDIWIVGTDYTPSGVEVGSLLKAQYTNAAYQDSDWITATKYDEKINELQDNLAVYDQYFSFDSADGLRISARDKNGSASQFSTSLTNERLSFNYGDDAIAYINGTKMNIKEAVIESPLTVTGKYSGSTMLQAPIINIGNFSIVVESNGSLSIIANT